MSQKSGRSEINVVYASEDGIEVYVNNKDRNSSGCGESGNRRLDSSQLSNIAIPSMKSSSVSFEASEAQGDDDEEDTPLSASNTEIVFSPFVVPDSPMGDSPRKPQSFDLLFSEEKEVKMKGKEEISNIPISIQHPTPSTITNFSVINETNEEGDSDSKVVNKNLFQVNPSDGANELERLRKENQRLHKEILNKDISLQTMKEKLRKEREEKRELIFKFNREHRKLIDERMKNSKKINDLLRKETETVSEIELLQTSEKKYKKIIRFLKTRESQYMSLMNERESKIQEQTQQISILKQDLTEMSSFIKIPERKEEEEEEEFDKSTTTTSTTTDDTESQEDILPLMVHHHQFNIRKHIPPVNSRIPRVRLIRKEEDKYNNSNSTNSVSDFSNASSGFLSDRNNLSIMSNVSSIKFLDEEMQEMLQETVILGEEEEQQKEQQKEEEEEKEGEEYGIGVDSELLEFERLTSMIDSAPAVDPRTFLEQEKLEKEANKNIVFDRWSM